MDVIMESEVEVLFLVVNVFEGVVIVNIML